MTGEVKSAFFWAVGLGLGFFVVGKVLGMFGQATAIPAGEVIG